MKGEYGIREIISQFQKEISYYSQMEALGATPYEKKYHQDLINERTEELIHLMEHYAENPGYAQLQPIPEKEPESVPELPPDIAPPPETVQPPEVPRPVTETPGEQRVFTLEELKSYNGEGDTPAYVAVNGVVYDVSRRIGWAGGTHFGLVAGNDLTGQFMTCHRGLSSILEQLPVVGVLVSE